MTDISDLPMLHDIDAHSPFEYVKLARILRDRSRRISARRHPARRRGTAHGAGVSVRVTCAAFAMLATNRYINRPRGLHLIPSHLAGGHMIPGRRRRVDQIPVEQSTVVGANVGFSACVRGGLRDSSAS